MRNFQKALAAAMMMGPLSAAAVSVIYSDQASILAAAGPVTVEDFNAQTNGATFHTTPLDVGPFTLSMTGSALTARNYIDAPPPEFTAFDVDGSTIANVLTENGISLFLDFDAPIAAFGVSLASFNDNELRTEILAAGTSTTPGPFGGSTVSFFGIVSDTAFTTVEFRELENDGFGMDYVRFATTAAPVPEPASLLLVGAGLAGIGAARRRSRG